LEPAAFWPRFWFKVQGSLETSLPSAAEHHERLLKHMQRCSHFVELSHVRSDDVDDEYLPALFGHMVPYQMA
jgi:hypothetical protein